MSDDDLVMVTDVFNSDRQLVRQTVTFDIANHLVADYCRDCSLDPDILRGEAVFLHPEGPIPYSLAGGRYLDSQIWGYILSYDSAARRLEVAPKDADGKVTVTTPWMLLK